MWQRVIDETNSAPAPVYDMVFDRPFVFAIYDKPTDSILFLGTLVDP